MELLLKYRERVQRWENKQKEEEDVEVYYLDKMDAGLYTLQVCIKTYILYMNER